VEIRCEIAPQPAPARLTPMKSTIANPRNAEGGELDLAPEFVCLSFNAWGLSPAPQFRDRANALALEDNQ
jgi:hypothetical protein